MSRWLRAMASFWEWLIRSESSAGPPVHGASRDRSLPGKTRVRARRIERTTS